MGARWARLYRGTPAERSLEPAVAALGVPYRTQFPCFLYDGGLRYFPDFVLPTLGLVIEVDDSSHFTPEGREADAARSADLARVYGWKVVRCTNREATEDPTGAVSRMLREAFPGHEGHVRELSRATPAAWPTHTPRSARRGRRSTRSAPSPRATPGKRR